MVKNSKSFVLIFVGAFLVALGTHCFFVPNSIAAGGISGLAIVINKLVPFISVGVLIMIMEAVLFIVGIIVIGPVFGGKTLFCSFSIATILTFLEKFFPMNAPFSNDLLLQLVFGVLTCGVGMAIAFNEGASTGGTDIIAKIINKYFKLSIGKSILIADIFVTAAAVSVFGMEKGLYSILGVLINGLLIDKAIQSMNMYTQVAIISGKGEIIKEFIMNNLDRTATIYAAKGAYDNNHKEVITAILERKEFVQLKEYISKIDREAFVTVNPIHEVLGNGF